MQRRQVWRLLTAQLSHVSGLHLLFNASALWNLGAIEQHSSALSAGGSGTLFYISYTMLFFVASALVTRCLGFSARRLSDGWFGPSKCERVCCTNLPWVTVLG